MSSVGQSQERTLGKHLLLNKVLGRLTGAFTRLNFLKSPFVFIDLCAGDGNPSFFSGYSSPEIIQKHAEFLRKTYGDKAAVVILVEQDKATFDRLKQSPHAQKAYLIQGNSRSPEVIQQIQEILGDRGVSSSSPCFVHNDPNKFSDFALTPELLALLPRYTTSLTTMGCNVGGLKRLGLSERKNWFAHVDLIVNHVKQVNCHNAYLNSLHGDKSQWAYLVTCPKKWMLNTEKDVQTSFKYWEKGLKTAWLSDSQKFNELIDFLFLTKKEFEENVTQSTNAGFIGNRDRQLWLEGCSPCG